MTHKLSLSILFFVLIASPFFLNACDNGHDNDDHGHYSPIGIVLSMDGEMIAAQEQTTITYATGDAIYVPAGTTTETITVEFLDDDGSHFTPHGHDSSLRYDIGDADVLSITHPAGDDEWSLRMTGNQPGSTTVQFDLWHDGHSDFTSRELQVRVEE